MAVVTRVIQYAKKLYPEDSLDLLDSDGRDADIEDEIGKELEGLQQPSEAPLFVPVKINMDCGQQSTVVSLARG